MRKRKQPDKRVVPPISKEALEEVRRLTAEESSGLPGYNALITLDQALLVSVSAKPLPEKKPQQ